MVPFEKRFYTPHPNVVNADPRMVEKFRFEKEIMVVKGTNIPHPITSFEEAGVPDYVMREVQRQSYAEPTAIQAQGWPIALSGIHEHQQDRYTKFDKLFKVDFNVYL